MSKRPKYLEISVYSKFLIENFRNLEKYIKYTNHFLVEFYHSVQGLSNYAYKIEKKFLKISEIRILCKNRNTYKYFECENFLNNEKTLFALVAHSFSH